jgi:hypothetical protein
LPDKGRLPVTIQTFDILLSPEKLFAV